MNNVAKICLLQAAPPVTDERLRDIVAGAYNDHIIASPIEVASIAHELIDARCAQRMNEALDRRQRRSGIARLLAVLGIGTTIACGGNVDPIPDADTTDASTDVVTLDSSPTLECFSFQLDAALETDGCIPGVPCTNGDASGVCIPAGAQ